MEMPEDTRKPFPVPEEEAGTAAVVDVYPMLLKFAGWDDEWEDFEELQPFPLRRIAPGATDYLVQAGFFSLRDIKALVRKFHWDVDPKDRHSFYDALLDRAEAEPWILSMVESTVVEVRSGGKFKRESRPWDKYERILVKLPLSKLRIKNRPDLQERLSELHKPCPLSPDLAVALFFEYSIHHFCRMFDDEWLDDRYYDLMVDQRLMANAIEGFFRDAKDSGRWRSLGRLLADLLSDRTSCGRVELEFLARIIRKLAAEAEPSWPAGDFLLVSELAGIAASISVDLADRELESVMKAVSKLGIEAVRKDLPPGVAAALVEEWAGLAVNHAVNLLGQKTSLEKATESAHARVARATSDRRYDLLADLAQQAAEFQETLQAVDANYGAARGAVSGILEGRIAKAADLPPALQRELDNSGSHATGAATDLEEDKPSVGRGPDAERTSGAADAPEAGAATASGEPDAPADMAETEVPGPVGDIADEEPRADAEDAVASDTESGETRDPDSVGAAPDGQAAAPMERETAPRHGAASASRRTREVPCEILADLIRRDLMGIAAEIGRALEAKGEDWPIEATLLNLAAACRIPHRDYGEDFQLFARIVQHSRSVVRSDEGSVLLLGAALVPAISQNDVGIRLGLPDLCRGILGTHLQEVADAVSGLTYDFPPEPDVLANLSGTNRPPRKTRIANALADWCAMARQKQAKWGFATFFMHHVASETGPIGQASAAISTGSSNASGLARAALEAIRDQESIESVSVDFAIANGRTSRLHRKGVEYLDRHFAGARVLLSDWQRANSRDGAGRSAETKLRTTVRSLRNRIEKAQKSLLAITRDPAEGALSNALAKWLASRLDEAFTVLEGGDVGRYETIADALSIERDLLPARARRELDAGEPDLGRLREALESDGIPEPIAAFDAACADGAFDAAARILDRHCPERKDRLQESMAVFVEKWRPAVEKRRQRMKTLAKLDYAFQEEIDRRLSWCETTFARLKEIETGSEVHDLDGVPDHVRELDEMARMIEARIREDQDARIRKHLSGVSSEEANAQLEGLDTLPVETREDRIAEIRDGRFAASFAIDLDGMIEDFTPEFVSQASGPGWPKSNAKYADAIAGDGPLATDEDRRPAALALIKLYRDIMRSAKSGRPAIAGIQKFFEEIGFEKVRLAGLRQVGGSKAWRVKLSGRITSDGWFLPPAFGSGATGGYVVFLLTSDTLPEAIQKTLESGTPAVLLVAGNADLARRHEFAERMRANAIPALFIDEALVAFAATRRETRARTIFECGLPYGRMEPYTTDPGSLPPEMFFGREAEIRSIMSKTADGCLVYGGRQLGKSALLAHVAGTRHDPGRKRIVKVLERKSLGDAEDISAIWAHLNLMLSEHGIVGEGSRTAETVCRDIRSWLNENPGGQIVCMFDEADNFMTADTRAGYPVLSELKSLMEGTGRAFKIVFAGLHNVKRMYRQPNSPLAHLGEPICIGPLNKNADDKRAAFELVVAPMRSAGFRFEGRDAVEQILAWANYYPSLVQEFAKGLLATQHGAGSGRQYQLSKDGPLWTIPTGELFSHGGFGQIETRIREKFQLTLSLDPRYALVAYTLAYLNAEGHEHKARVAGFAPTQLLEHVREFWPRTTEMPTQAAFEVLLDELFDLGVLGRVKLPGTGLSTYVLRSRQVAAMLGSWEEVVQALEQLKEVDPTLHYDRVTYRRRYAPSNSATVRSQKDWPYSPLADIQIERLLENSRERGAVRIVCGLGILDLPRVGQAMKCLVGMNQLSGAPTEGVDVEIVTSGRALRKAIDRTRPAGRALKLVVRKPASAQAAEDEIAWLEKRPEVIGSDGWIRPIVILDAADPEMRGVANRRERESEFLRPWGEEMIRFHLHDIECPNLDSRQIRQRILAATGGIPSSTIALIRELHGADDIDAAFSDWKPDIKLPAIIMEGDLGRALMAIEDAADPETFSAIEELLREEVGKDLVTIGPDLVATGLVADCTPKRQRIRCSALGEFIKNSVNN